jgi:hypothetical protein
VILEHPSKQPVLVNVIPSDVALASACPVKSFVPVTAVVNEVFPLNILVKSSALVLYKIKSAGIDVKLEQPSKVPEKLVAKTSYLNKSVGIDVKEEHP